jgi:hypothetical protein
MLENEKLARAISDVGFGMLRSQLEYKARRYISSSLIAGIQAADCAPSVVGRTRR